MSRSAATRATSLPPQRAAEPASLTQVSSSTAARCPSCTGTRLTRLSMTLTDGSPVDFTSCHTCEHRTWKQGSTALPIDAVLDKTRKRV